MLMRSVCLDEFCKCPIVYLDNSLSVTCRQCGQTHNVVNFTQTTQLDDASQHTQAILKNVIFNLSQTSHKGPEMVKVLGISNYHHKLLSPLLVEYGMDKHTGKARTLRELTGRPMLDCSQVFGERSFHIEKRQLDIIGYGRDQTGSGAYLADTLKLLAPYNDNREVLVPLHVDGDGHCLVHAVSRALVGRELFWHPLRNGLKHHFVNNIEKYKELLGDFINASEWPCIIAECDADYVPVDGDMVGLRTIHVFGLANMLQRPIILLDSIAGMNTSAEYSAVFLPGLSSPETCSNKNGKLNPPLCLAWSSSARNHYIPLVPIKDQPLPRFPKKLLPKVWGFPQFLLDRYIEFDENNCLTIGGESCLTAAYMLKLTAAMDELFLNKHSINAELVADVYHYHYSRKTGVKMAMVLEAASAALQEHRLMRCLLCDAVCILPLSGKWLRPRGLLYTLAKKQYGFLQEHKTYPFYSYGVTCTYNAKKDMLVLDSTISLEKCTFCKGSQLRMVASDGSVMYEDGDITSTPVSSPDTNRCPCGYKHWYRSNEYENPPQEISVVLKWNGNTVKDVVQWFQYESDPRLNSNVYHIATCLLQKHFPGEFGSERLHQSIVSQIMEFVKDLPAPTKLPLVYEKVEEASGSVNVKDNAPLMRVSRKVNTEPSCSKPETYVTPQVPSASKRGNESETYSTPMRIGPGMSVLSSTPATQDAEAMEKFFKLMNKKPSSCNSKSTDRDSPGPSTSKQSKPH